MSRFTHPKDTWKVLLVFCVLALCLTVKQSMERNAPVNTEWTLSSQHVGPRSFAQCDAAGEYLYFSYQNSRSSVDVYDRQACYLYTLVFSDRENGVIYLRCDQDEMYIKLRNDYVYVFRGKEELACLTESEADSKGYTNAWFKNADSRLVVADSILYLLDEQGQRIDQMVKPEEIKEPFRLELSETAYMVVKILCVLLFFCFCGYVIFSAKAKSAVP